MTGFKIFGGAVALCALETFGIAQGANPVPPKRQSPSGPKVATQIPTEGIHLATTIGAFKIKRGSEAPNYGSFVIHFQGTVLVSGLKGTATPSNGAELEFSQENYNKHVYFSKGKGTLAVTGQFNGIQFFGQNMDAYYRGDGVIQLFGEFDKNLNTGTFWWDQNPKEKRYWGTSGQTVTPGYPSTESHSSQIKIKNVTGKG